MKLGYTILHVASVAETLAFYEEAFGLERGMKTDANEYGELKNRQHHIGIRRNDVCAWLA